MTTVPTRFWQDMTTEDFAALDRARTVAILPVAAIEQHGPHLPVSVDADIGHGVIARALTLMPEDLPAIVLPMMPVGLSPEHIGFPGTLTLAPETALRLWNDLGDSVARAGLRKLLVFNSHGGNPPAIEIVARDLRIRHGLFVAFASWYGFGLPDGLFPAEEIRHGIHGGAVETSMMLHLHPDRVRLDKLAAFPSRAAAMARDHKHLSATGRIRYGWLTQDLNPGGAVGDATLADAEKGRRLIDHAARGLVALLADIARFPLESLETGRAE